MFLTSDEDGLIWPELSKTVHAHVPGSRFERVEAAGHSTYFERPDVFNREVGAFLKAASAMKWCRFQSGRTISYGIIEDDHGHRGRGQPVRELTRGRSNTVRLSRVKLLVPVIPRPSTPPASTTASTSPRWPSAAA